MKIFKTIGQNIYDPIYYRVVRSEPLGSSLKYYYRLVLLLALIITIFLSLIFVPPLVAFTKLVKTEGATWYPAELTVTIKNGQVSTNVLEPYKLKNLLVIDTKNSFNLDQFKAYQTPVWLTADSFIYDDNNGITIKPIAKEVSLVIDQAKISSWISKLSPLLTILVPLLVIGLFLMIIIAFSFYLLALFLVALFVILVGRLKQIKLSYGEAYRVAVHAATLPLIISALAWFLAPFANLHFLPTIILLLIAAVNLKDQV